MARVHPVSLDRQGNPISPQAFSRPIATAMSSKTTVAGPGIEPVPEPPPLSHYVSEPKRDIEAWEVLQLLDMWIKSNGPAHGFSLRLAPEAYQALDGNMRRHFRARHKTPSA